jgi:hypothetical protein
MRVQVWVQTSDSKPERKQLFSEVPVIVIGQDIHQPAELRPKLDEMLARGEISPEVYKIATDPEFIPPRWVSPIERYTGSGEDDEGENDKKKKKKRP